MTAGIDRETTVDNMLQLMSSTGCATGFSYRVVGVAVCVAKIPAPDSVEDDLRTGLGDPWFPLTALTDLSPYPPFPGCGLGIFPILVLAVRTSRFLGFLVEHLFPVSSFGYRWGEQLIPAVL